MQVFAEPFRLGWQQNILIKSILYDGRSAFQHIQVLDTVPFGRMLVLDDACQTSVVDEYIYHEMLVHVPMMAHPDPCRALIIGGGDGGALRRVLQYPAVKATMVEIDADVVRVSREFTPSIAGDAFENPRAEVFIDDGVKYLHESTEHFDVILVDSTDPVGPAVELFGESFYRDAARAIGDNGIIVTQSGSPLVMMAELIDAVHLMRRVFPIVRTYICSIPLYPGVLWSFTAASNTIDPANVDAGEIAARLHRNGQPTGWYTPAIHKAAFALPNFIGNALQEKDDNDAPTSLALPISGE